MNQVDKLEIEIAEYFEQLCVKLQEIGNSNLEQGQSRDAYKLFKIISGVLDQMIKLYSEGQSQYQLLEEQTVKYESECRNHIRIEQRLKVHCESLQDLCEELQKQEVEQKQKIAVLQQDNKQLRRDLDLISKQELQRLDGRTSSIIDKLILDHRGEQKTVSKHQINLNTLVSTQKKHQIQLRINRRKPLQTEHYDYQTMQILNQISSKQSYDESKQYSSLEKLQDVASIYSRPKSRAIQEVQNKRSVTLHISNYQQVRNRSKSQIKKY